MKSSDPLDARWLTLWLVLAAILISAPLLLANPSRAEFACAEQVGTWLRPARMASVRIAPHVSKANESRWELEEILTAIRHVESGGCDSHGVRAIGDGGRALGPFQIHRAYWQDSRIPGRFEDCFDATYARTVVLSYWRRHCPEELQALDAQALARVHNGGPSGSRKASTLGYWLKVERMLTDAESRSHRSSD